MITLTKNGNAIVFTFSDNAHYLFDGTIEVPVNSLTLVTDNSQMATFKKSASNDIFISATYAELGMSKSELESWFKENACGSTGGGGVTSGEVETMIETSLEDYYDIDDVDAALSAKANTATTYTKTEVDTALANKADTATTYTKTEVDNALGDKADTSAVTEAITAAVSGKADTSSVYTKSEVDAALDDKADSSAVTQEISAAVSGKADTSSVYTKSEVDTALSGKQDTLIAGDNITISGNVISADGGGKAVSGGTNISITTGETADTINCTLPITAGTGIGSIIIGNGKARGQASLAIGDNSKNISLASESKGTVSFSVGLKAIANKSYSSAIGNRITTNNENEFSCGMFNNSVSASATFGDSGNTLFSVGNGTADNARHNALEVRQNGDIYISLNGQDVKLQDQLGGGSITIDPTLDSGSTNAVANSAITSQFNSIDSRLAEDEEVTAAGLNALNDALSGKADTSAVTAISNSLSGYVQTSAVTTSVTSASTDTEIPTAKATYDAIQAGGGGGATYSAGTNISIANDTINCTLPISADTNTISTNKKNIKIGYNVTTSNLDNRVQIAIGDNVTANGIYSFAFGQRATATNYSTVSMGYETESKNQYQVSFGKYNSSNTGSTDADNTLLSVGNGTSNSARHNAFEIRQNGDIYITKDGQDVKLQDQLGGGSITIDPTLDSGSTNAVANSAITSQFNSIDSRLAEDEEVTAAGLNALNDALGGLKLVKLTQAEYDALATKDANTLYIISNVVS